MYWKLIENLQISFIKRNDCQLKIKSNYLTFKQIMKNNFVLKYEKVKNNKLIKSHEIISNIFSVISKVIFISSLSSLPLKRGSEDSEDKCGAAGSRTLVQTHSP